MWIFYVDQLSSFKPLRTGHELVVHGPQFVEELQPRTRLLLLVPVERCLDSEIGWRFRNQPIFCHLLLLARRSRT